MGLTGGPMIEGESHKTDMGRSPARRTTRGKPARIPPENLPPLAPCQREVGREGGLKSLGFYNNLWRARRLDH